MTGAERFVQLFCWILPGFVAGWSWGLSVGLMTFGGQMLAAPAVVRLYINWAAGRPGFSIETARRFVVVAHIVTGCLCAFIAKWAVDRGYVV